VGPWVRKTSSNDIATCLQISNDSTIVEFNISVASSNLHSLMINHGRQSARMDTVHHRQLVAIVTKHSNIYMSSV
jgi:hypothetical protein